jgi:hypothetical protein
MLCPPNLPSVSDLPRDPGDLRSERAELIHHGVDSVLEFEDFSPDIDGDLAREIPFGHGRSDFRPKLARAAALQLIGLNYVSGFRIVHSDRDEYRFPPCDGEKKSQINLISEDSHRAQVPIQSRTKPLNATL